MKKRILCLFLGLTMMFSQVMTVSASGRKEELEQEEKEEQSKKDSTDFYKVIEELKKKNKKDKPLSYGNNSGNSYILNNR